MMSVSDLQSFSILFSSIFFKSDYKHFNLHVFISKILIPVLVVDKFVPSRARASLPTSYLYFEPSRDDGSNAERKFQFDGVNCS